LLSKIHGIVLPQSFEVSIIVVNYNEIELLRQCLHSILEFTKDISYEIIVVDNASTVGNVSAITKEFPLVNLVINEANLGFAAANNVGLKHANGKYVLFLNNDTKFTSNVLKDVHNFTDRFEEPVFVGCQLLNADLSKQESISNFPTLWNNFTENFYLYKLFPKSGFFNKYYQNYHEYENPIEVEVIRGAFMFCSTGAVKELNGFDERFFFYSEETDLCYRFKMKGNKIFFLPKSSVIHYGGATTDKDLWFKYKNQTIGKIQYYQKNFRGIKFTLAILFHFIGLFLRWIQNSLIGLVILRKSLLIKGFYFLRQMFVYPQNRFKEKSQNEL
jgi:O-antigen biosynthesis protein